MDHWVLVDDTDPGIQYSGPWFTVENTQLDTGNWGPPSQDTLHGVNVSASLSFPFNGSEVMVFGTIEAAGPQNPTWECFVDDASIGANSVLSRANNNQNLCQSSQLQDGLHVLTVNATVSSPLNPFWIDEIAYLPSSNLSLAQAMVHIDSNDSAVQYSSGWDTGPATVKFTQTAGATVTYEFFGVSIVWFSYIPLNFSLIPSTAAYSIDGHDPISFDVPALSSNDTFALLNQALFQAVPFSTGELAHGEHKLVVTHQGNSSTAPLALTYFVVDGPLSPSNSTSSSSGNTPTSTISSSVPSGSSSNSTSNSDSGTKSNLGAIIGGVLGGFILLLILFFYIRRHNHQRAQKLIEKPSPDDLNASTVRPFQVSPTLPARNHSTSGGQSLTTHPTPFPAKSPKRRPVPVISLAQASTSSSTIPVLAPSQNDSSAGNTHLIDGMTTNAREAETVQQPTTQGSGDTTFLWHEDSGVRIPFAQQGNVVELPPSYTQN